MPIISAVYRQRQKDHKVRANLGNRARPTHRDLGRGGLICTKVKLD